VSRLPGSLSRTSVALLGVFCTHRDMRSKTTALGLCGAGDAGVQRRWAVARGNGFRWAEPMLRALISFKLAIVAVIITTGSLTATTDVEINNDFMISRDFAEFQIKKNAKVFFYDDLIYEGNQPKKRELIRDLSHQFLKNNFILVDKRQEAEYILRIRMDEYVDYAIRNPEKSPALAFILFGVCITPVSAVEKDCYNLTFYFFRKNSLAVIFDNAFHMWINRIVMP
jgi:hypothetical protein